MNACANTFAISFSRALASLALTEMAFACFKPSESFFALSSVRHATVTATPALSSSTAVGRVTNPAPRRRTFLLAVSFQWLSCSDYFISLAWMPWFACCRTRTERRKELYEAAYMVQTAVTPLELFLNAESQQSLKKISDLKKLLPLPLSGQDF